MKYANLSEKKVDQTDIKAVCEELHTVRDYLRWAMSQFNQTGLHYGHGTDNAWDEAVALVLYTLHLPPDTENTILDARLTLQERQLIIRLIQRRVQERVPVAYLTHQSWFAGLAFYVDERVLIPRSPMAELIEKHFRPWVDPERVERILDLCTGSACIAIACAMHFPGALVDAIDISQPALEVAKLNVEKHQLQEQVRVIHSDLFQALAGQTYDIIISNPPYVSVEEFATLPPEYQHEPELGFLAGKEGLDIVVQILRQAKEHLTPQGVLMVEVGNSQHELIERFPQIPFTWLEFERGEDGVFLLTAEQLQEIDTWI